ncbi:probable E3 ubiquitin-protein ligase RNF217 [Brienomyrus brachyistius]|uniref:probable E3 ubiquitin-protein ligase RNF217 n=1 Tax=Brienomyrus brachyistius TaxID=42636 RepID=UPI0020B3A853|nr:probable E3 ubiquitin-protein ligase RNF217 [Brienomyrus brachyistius]
MGDEGCGGGAAAGRGMSASLSAADAAATPGTDFVLDSETKVVAPDGVWVSQEATGDKENAERRTGAAEILRSLGPPGALSGWGEHRDASAEDAAFKKQADGSVAGGHRTGDRVLAELAPGPTPSDPDGAELPGPAEACWSRPTCGALRPKEHVYCTVYCIANDSPGGQARLHGTFGTPPAAELEGLQRYPEPLALTALIESRSSGNFSGVEPSSSVPVTCRVCLDDKRIKPLHCCKKAVCDECLKLYISSQVYLGKVDVVCPITECSGYLEESTVLGHLASEEVAKYKYFLELSKIDSSTKPCPQCSHFTSLKSRGLQPPSRAEHKYKVQCTKCQFVWCFKCHAPWHEGLRCREYRKGDKLLRHWASVIEHGQRNAQKCPRCKIHIQRTEGCDHMTCTQCNTNFCYRCGEKYRHLRFFGDHTSNLSVFGCKYRYLPDRPHLRRLVRGSVCVSKILIAPLVVVLVGVFGAIAFVIGLIAFPVYYICKKRRKRSQGTGHWFC